jgi:hypothetical protein
MRLGLSLATLDEKLNTPANSVGESAFSLQ